MTWEDAQNILYFGEKKKQMSNWKVQYDLILVEIYNKHV